MKLVVTIPALNEERTIAQVIRGIPLAIPGVSSIEIIVVNDGSTDRTAAFAEQAGATVITIKGGQGLGQVFRTAMDHAIRRGADLLVNIDGDGQFNSRDIAQLIRPLLDGDADFVTCSRFSCAGYIPDMTRAKRWGNRLVTWMMNKLCGTELTDASCGFRAYNRDAAYRLTQFGRWTYVEECLLDLSGKGIRIAEVPLVVRGEREFGTSRVASSVVRYGVNLLEILLRAARDMWPMEIFCLLAAMAGLPALALWMFLAARGIMTGGMAPFAGLLPLAEAMIVVAFLLFALAMLADMMRVHRHVDEELLYLARRRLYGRKRSIYRSSDAAPTDDPGASASARCAAETTEEISISAMHIGSRQLTDG